MHIQRSYYKIACTISYTSGIKSFVKSTKDTTIQQVKEQFDCLENNGKTSISVVTTDKSKISLNYSYGHQSRVDNFARIIANSYSTLKDKYPGLYLQCLIETTNSKYSSLQVAFKEIAKDMARFRPQNESIIPKIDANETNHTALNRYKRESMEYVQNKSFEQFKQDYFNLKFTQLNLWRGLYEYFKYLYTF